jgi:hypothetical protein
MGIEILYCCAVIVGLVSGLAIGVCLWWWFNGKLRDWWWRAVDMEDDAFTGIMDFFLGKHTNGDGHETH